MSEQRTLSGGTTEKGKTTGTQVYCACCAEFVLRSRKHLHDLDDPNGECP